MFYQARLVRSALRTTKQVRTVFNRQNEYQRFKPKNESISPNRRPVLVACAAITGGYGAYWYFKNQDVVEWTGRQRLMAVSRESELRMGEMAFEELKRQHASTILPHNHPWYRAVWKVCSELIEASGQDHTPAFRWELLIVNSRMANAACLPGGKIVVYTGILPILPDENSLAVVLAHEIGHALARHGAEKMSSFYLVMAVDVALQLIVGMNFAYLTRIVSELAFNLPFSRKLEIEADEIGLALMTKGR